MNDFVGKKMGELAEKQAANQLGAIGQKVLNAGKNNFVRGAISGATGGAVSGGMATALNGGDLGQVLGNAVSTAGSGALQGGISGSVNGKLRQIGQNVRDDIWAGKPSKDFGKAYTQFSGKPEEAIDYLMYRKKGEVPAALKNASLGEITGDGNIDLVYGKNGEKGYGLAHILEKHGTNTVKRIPDIIQNGEVIQPDGANDRIYIRDKNNKGVVRLNWDDNKKQWLTTAYELDDPVLKGASNSNSLTTGTSPIRDPSNTLVNQTLSQNGQNINSKTSAAGQLRLKAAQALLDQYGTIDKPMARSANALENVQRVADAGFVKPADVENIINNITGANGKITKLTQKLVSTAKPVDTSSDINKIIDEQIALNGLSGTADEKAIRASIEAQLGRLPSRREGSITGLDQPEDVFDTIKALEKRSAELKGKSGNNYRLTTPERGDKAKVLDSITDVLKDRLYSGANIAGVLTPDVADELKGLAPKNEKWANYVDNTIMKSGDVGELRNTVAPFVNMGKVIDNQYMNYGTYGQRVGDAANEGRRIAGMVSKTPVLGKLLGDIASSNVADRVRAKAYNYMADQVETRNNPTNLSTTTSKQPKIPDNKITNLSSLLLGREVIPQTALSMIGRGVGNENAYKVQNAMRANANDNIPDYNSQDLVGDNINHVSQQSNVDSSPIIGQLTRIGDAMQLALNAGDVASYSKLAGLYGDMMNVYKTQQAMFNPQAKATKLTDSQKKANVAMDLLNNLEGQQANIGSAVADVPILGGLMNIGGNEYKSSAEALESALGYLQSGAQISEKERESIRRAYIPQWGESEAVKKRKLAAARQVIQNFAKANAEE